jgi:hypothetical protein
MNFYEHFTNQITDFWAFLYSYNEVINLKTKQCTCRFNGVNIVTCRRVRMTIMTGYRADDWIYWHFSYNLS